MKAAATRVSYVSCGAVEFLGSNLGSLGVMGWCWTPVIALLESMDVAIVGEYALDVAIVICDESCCKLQGDKLAFFRRKRKRCSPYSTISVNVRITFAKQYDFIE